MMSNPARQALARGDFAAVRLHAAALAARPETAAEARFLIGIVEAGEGRVSAGLAHLEAAISLGATAEYLAQHGRLLLLLRREAEARAAAAAAEAMGPDDALTFDTIGNIHARLGDHHAALACFAPAVARDGGNLDYRYNLAAALGFVGRNAEAAAEYEFILARAPTNGRAHHALSGLSRVTPEHNHIARLEAALAGNPPIDDGLRIRYALAKEYEDIGAPAKAFRHLAAANAAHKARIAYDFSADDAIFDAIEAHGNNTASISTADAAPIFITGMPRTGTTLVDRILSAHPQVCSAGELQAMPLAIKQLSGTRSRKVIDPETIAAAAGLSSAAIADTYMARAGQHLRNHDGRFIDKLPANFLYIGHIARAFPRASIICLRRNPMDTVWSNYKNLFAAGSAYYFYSYDLLDTARYFARFDRLMAFWDRCLPGRVLQLSYEALVAGQEAESRRLYAHCRLDWTDAALSFHRSTAPVATPSAAQVRQPIYRDAIERWRDHAAEMAPVAAFFAAAGIAIEG